jgi:hypothetical protein
MAGNALNLGANGMSIVSSPAGATFTSNRQTVRSIGESTGLCAVAGGTCSMQGFFADAGAARAGIVYEANTLVQGNKQPTGGVTAAGAAALTLKR